MAETDTESQGWMADVQRAIALILIVSFALVTLFASVCAVFWPDSQSLTDMAKTLQAALVNMALIALGFFFGSSMAKQASDVRQQNMMEKMTPTAPSAAIAVSAQMPPWWAKLTDAEKNNIAAAMAADPRIETIKSAMTAGAANADDLSYLVSKNLLTQERADTIQKV